MKNWIVFLTFASLAIFLTGCPEEAHKTTSDDIQQQRQEKLLQELVAQVGMPNIKNFREAKMFKEIQELRDQASLITYTYMENVVPRVIPGHTACGGKLHFIKESISYGIPASTQFTNPQKAEVHSTYDHGRQWITLPQADPNGLFSPATADATWIMMNDDKAGKAMPQYSEPHLMVFTIKFPFDTVEDLKASMAYTDGLTAEKK